jgi:hypothetical protein
MVENTLWFVGQRGWENNLSCFLTRLRMLGNQGRLLSLQRQGQTYMRGGYNEVTEWGCWELRPDTGWPVETLVGGWRIPFRGSDTEHCPPGPLDSMCKGPGVWHGLVYTANLSVKWSGACGVGRVRSGWLKCRIWSHWTCFEQETLGSGRPGRRNCSDLGESWPWTTVVHFKEGICMCCIWLEFFRVNSEPQKPGWRGALFI